VIQLATPTADDAGDLVDLLEEMDRSYGVTAFEPAEDRITELQKRLFTGPPAAHVVLAHADAVLVGLASYSFLWPAVGLTQSLFLKELYVRTNYQGQGIGRALMGRIFQIAADTGCSRVEWMTEQANTGAQAFYEKVGVAPDTEKVFYRATTTVPSLRSP
jgi:GNAT superfamily N-acetyltransferase